MAVTDSRQLIFNTRDGRPCRSASRWCSTWLVTQVAGKTSRMSRCR